MRGKQRERASNIATHLTVVGVLEQELYFLDCQLRILTERKNIVLGALNQHEQFITGAAGAKRDLNKPSLHIVKGSIEPNKARQLVEPEPTMSEYNLIEQ